MGFMAPFEMHLNALGFVEYSNPRQMERGGSYLKHKFCKPHVF